MELSIQTLLALGLVTTGVGIAAVTTLGYLHGSVASEDTNHIPVTVNKVSDGWYLVSIKNVIHPDACFKPPELLFRPTDNADTTQSKETPNGDRGNGDSTTETSSEPTDDEEVNPCEDVKNDGLIHIELQGTHKELIEAMPGAHLIRIDYTAPELDGIHTKTYDVRFP